MRMLYNQTAIGWSHLQNKMPCQDFSASYRDGERAIVTCCDGHGGAVYLRSERGAKFASHALINVLRGLNVRSISAEDNENLKEQLRVQLLCEWNKFVERDLARHKLSHSKLAKLNENERDSLKNDPVRAYGTTAQGAMLVGKWLVCLSIGDGGCFLFRKGELTETFPDEEDDGQVANLTHSLCQSSAGKYLKVGIFDSSKYDGILLCSDGVINPFQNIDNFEKSFVQPALEKLSAGLDTDVYRFIEQLGAKLGSGDDVSLAIVAKNRDKVAPKKHIEI